MTLDAGVRWDSASASVDAEKASTDLTWAYHGTRATERDDSLPGGSLRARWQAAEGLELSLGAGTAARVPEPQERWFSLQRMGTDWVGNPDLEPSRNTALDLSASYRAGRLYVSASGFLNEVDDYIVLADVKKVNMVPGVMNPMARTYENVDARLAGGEATAALTLTDRLFLSGSVSYVRGTQDPRPELGILSTNVAEMPPVTGRASLRWDDGRFWVESEGVFAAAQTNVDTDLQESTTPGWGIANLQGRHRLRRHRPERRRREPLRASLLRAPLLSAGPLPVGREDPGARPERLRQPLVPLLIPSGAGTEDRRPRLPLFIGSS